MAPSVSGTGAPTGSNKLSRPNVKILDAFTANRHTVDEDMSDPNRFVSGQPFGPSRKIRQTPDWPGRHRFPIEHHHVGPVPRHKSTTVSETQ